MATTKKKRSTVETTPAHNIRSFRRSPEELPFFQFRITQQSVYWLILCLLILGLGIWVVTLSVKVQSLYDQIETSSMQTETPSNVKSY